MLGKNNQVILKGFENEDTDFDKKELDVSISNIVFAHSMLIKRWPRFCFCE